MFQRLVYVSQATPGVGVRDCFDIIRVAHNRNSQYGLTGALLFLDGFFIQVLEGNRLRMQERFQRIAADPRHVHVDVRQSVESSSLLFPGDWMALRSASEIDPAVLQRLGYQPGLPADRFSGEQIVELVMACCAPYTVSAAADA